MGVSKENVSFDEEIPLQKGTLFSKSLGIITNLSLNIFVVKF